MLCAGRFSSEKRMAGASVGAFTARCVTALARSFSKHSDARHAAICGMIRNVHPGKAPSLGHVLGRQRGGVSCHLPLLPLSVLQASRKAQVKRTQENVQRLEVRASRDLLIKTVADLHEFYYPLAEQK
jgi:hypothetical protein